MVEKDLIDKIALMSSEPINEEQINALTILYKTLEDTSNLSRDKLIELLAQRRYDIIIKNLIKQNAILHKKMYEELFKNTDPDDLLEYYKSYYCVNNLPDSYVYLIKNNINGYIKIGTSNDPYKRIQQISQTLKNLCGFENDILEMVSMCYCPHNDGYKIENFFHKKYSQYRKFGEWFDFGDDFYDTIGYYFPEYINVMEYKDDDFKNVDIDGFEPIQYIDVPLENFIIFEACRLANKYYEDVNKSCVNHFLVRILTELGVEEVKPFFGELDYRFDLSHMYKFTKNIQDDRLLKIFEYYMSHSSNDNIGLCGKLYYDFHKHLFYGKTLRHDNTAILYSYNNRISAKILKYAFDESCFNENDYLLKVVTQ